MQRPSTVMVSTRRSRAAWCAAACATESTLRKRFRAWTVLADGVAPRLYGNARVSYAFGGDLPTLALAAYSLSSRLTDRGLTAGFNPHPIAPALVDLRATVSGDVSFIEGLSYRISGSYLTVDEGAYVVGPALVGTDVNPRAELAPLPTLRASLGLQYTFWAD
jgi:hypothetical protein